MSPRMPSVFFGHGNPMNALLRNSYTEQWAAIGTRLPRPKAVLCVSAHWYIQDAAVTISTSPKTLHDFGGVPRELYQLQYPAPGDPDLAARVQKFLAPSPVRLDERWGLDHGTGPCCATCTLERMFRSFNSALTRTSRHPSIMKSASALHFCGTKAF